MRRALRLAAVLAALLAARPASAQLLEVVELKDGSVYQGELVERVDGQRVVIKLATGAVRKFAWDQIKSAAPAPAPASSPAPLPAPTRSPPDPPDLPLLPPAPSPDTSWTPSPSPAPAAFDPSHVISGWPDPHATATGAAHAWTTAYDLGLVSSLPQFGSPRGIIGVGAEVKPLRWLGVELDGAYDGPAEVAEGNLGWSVVETLRLGNAFGLGVGLSQHFGAIGNGVAQMGHVELSFDLDFGGLTATPIVLRMAPGITTMFNAADHPGACGFFNLAGGQTDDAGNPIDKSCLVFYFDVSVFYRIGGEAQ